MLKQLYKHKWSCFCSRNSASGAHSNRKGQKAVNCKDHTPLDLPQQITAKKINKRMTKGNYHGSLKKTFTKCALKHLDIFKTTKNPHCNGHLKTVHKRRAGTKCDSCSVVMFFNQCSIVTSKHHGATWRQTIINQETISHMTDSARLTAQIIPVCFWKWECFISKTDLNCS